MCQTTDLSIVQANGTGRNSGAECITRTCASGVVGVVDSAEVCNIRIHRLPERQVKVRKSGGDGIGASPVGKEPLCSTIGLDEAKEDTRS
jgi:hypothetical protein